MRRDPDKAKAWRQRSKPIPRESTKRKTQNRERRSVLAEVVHGKTCAAQLDGCAGMAVDGHELLSRARGGSITDPDGIVGLCRSCHTWITEHPAYAYENGWAFHAWEKKDASLPDRSLRERGDAKRAANVRDALLPRAPRDTNEQAQA